MRHVARDNLVRTGSVVFLEPIVRLADRYDLGQILTMMVRPADTLVEMRTYTRACSWLDDAQVPRAIRWGQTIH